MDFLGPSVSVVLTCRDEKENIEPLLQSIPQLGREQEIIFVEGHSSDGTRAEIERCMRKYADLKIRLVDQPGIGQGDAIHAGFSAAIGDILILLEADMTTPPAEIQAVFEPIRAGGADFVQGSRFPRPRRDNAMPWLNRLGNRLFALWFTVLLGRRLSDVLGGLKAIRRSAFQCFAPRWGRLGLRDPFGDFELLLGAAQAGCRIAEAPISYCPRSYGRSKTRVVRHGSVLALIALRASFRRWA